MTSPEATMPDVTYAIIDEMEAIYEGVARRARAELGVTGWGMQVMTLPPNWGDYPNHNHDVTTGEAGQEEVYIPTRPRAHRPRAAGQDARALARPGPAASPASPATPTSTTAASTTPTVS
jgi:hypothetical protein